jgi:hypothetical protein
MFLSFFLSFFLSHCSVCSSLALYLVALSRFLFLFLSLSLSLSLSLCVCVCVCVCLCMHIALGGVRKSVRAHLRVRDAGVTEQCMIKV